MLQIDMEMPEVCVTEDGYSGSCPMDRLWCAQRYAPEDYTQGQIDNDQIGKLPSWCPWKEVGEK